MNRDQDMNRWGWTGDKVIRRLVISVLILSLLAVPVSSVLADTSGQQSDALASDAASRSAVFDQRMQQALEKAEAVILNETDFPIEGAVGFAKNRTPLPKGFREKLADRIMDAGGKFNSLSDHVRISLGYMAAGGDINRIGSIDLHALLMNHAGLERAGVPELAEAYLMSWYYHPTALNRLEWYPDLIVYRLRERQTKEGGWSARDSGPGDIRTTAKVLTAIGSPDEPSSKPALDWLQTKLEGSRTSDLETTAVSDVVIALSSIGLDAAAFSETGVQLMDTLLGRQLPGGAFAEVEDGSASMEATVQAYLALTAYKLYAEAGDRLYASLNHPIPNKTRVHVEGPEGTIAEGWMELGSNENLVEAAAAFLKKSGVAYTTRVSEHGALFTSIGGVTNGRYGGLDKWEIAVRSIGNWYILKDDLIYYSDPEEMLLYYSDQTALVDHIQIEWKYENGLIIGGTPRADTPFTLTLKKATRQFGHMAVSSGIQVSLGGKTAVTDKSGRVSFPGLKPGVYELTVTSYRQGRAPLLAKRTVPFPVSSPELSSFTDAGKVSKWAAYDVASALSEGWMQGVSPGPRPQLAPKRAMTRAEFVVMLLRVLREPANPRSSRSFADVPGGRWYSGEISRAVKLGIIGDKLRYFGPGELVTREEAAVMMANALGLQPLGSPERVPFKDTAGLPESSKRAIQILYEQEIMKGEGRLFHPEQTLVREEAAAVLNRLAQLMPYREI